MAEISEEKLDVVIALLAQLVAASVGGDPVLALTNAGMRQADVAKLLGVTANSVTKRVGRAGAKAKAPRRKNAKAK